MEQEKKKKHTDFRHGVIECGKQMNKATHNLAAARRHTSSETFPVGIGSKKWGDLIVPQHSQDVTQSYLVDIN